MRRVPGLGTTSFSITFDARRKRGCRTSISAIGSKGRRACNTRSDIAHSNGSGRPDGSASLPKSKALLSVPSQALGARTRSASKVAARTAHPAASSSISSRKLRRLIVALAASASLICSPVAAQDAQTLPSLEELIPDEAVADPEAWAGQGVPPGAAAAEDAPGELDSASPLTDLPEIDLPWPEQQELPQLAPLESEEDIEFAEFGDIFPEQVELGAEERISDELVLVFPRD